MLAMLTIQGCSGSREETHARQVADHVRIEFLHAWNNYERYAWSHDDLRPLSKTAHDWYGQSLLMAPVDALDTLVLMNLDAEAAKTRSLIVNELSFDRDVYVKNFEVMIRLLGGLLSSYQLTGDKRLLNLAEDLGTRLLPVFNSPTGLPYVYVNLRSGEVRDAVTNPAETGTLLLEFGTLSKLTGKPIFYEKAKRALVETYKRRSVWLDRQSTSRPVCGRTPTVISAAESIHTTSISGNAGDCSAIKIAAICGTRAFLRFTNTSLMR
jgi:ER degradation enhancer, mannosidase alpha-like 2